MSRPTNKEELLNLSQSNFKKLNDWIGMVSDINQEFSEGYMNRNIRDVLAHLHHWHLMMIDWYNIGMTGERPTIPAKGYTWKDTPTLNKKIWEDYQNIDFEDIKNRLNNSHSELQKIIEQHTNEELFEKKKYKWTGTTSLAAYVISATSSHYDWALKLVKKALK